MTAPALGRIWDEPLERIRLRPAEGWLTVLMVGLLVESFVWSLQDAAWVPDSQGSTAAVFYLAIAGIAVELFGAKAGWGRWWTHLVGGIIGGLVLPLVAAVTVLTVREVSFDLTDIGFLYRTAGDVAYNVWADFNVYNRAFTTEFGHYHMVFGALAWAGGMLASSAVFQRRRPFDAVVVIGLLLVTNMYLTAKEQLPYLVVFSIAALILLVRAHTFEEQVTWVRRRIGDPAAVSALYLQGGASFVGVAVVAALVLTITASSAPLQGLWTDLPSRLSGLAEWVQRFAPSGGEGRTIDFSGFGESAFMGAVWEPATGTAFVAKLPSNSGVTFKWRAGTYSVYDGVARWSWGQTSSYDVPAGEDVMAQTDDDPKLLEGRKEIEITIQTDKYTGAAILSPQALLSVDRNTTVQLTGQRYTAVEASSGSGTYTIKALIPDLSVATGLTQNKLRATPRQYPSDVMANYLDVAPGALGDESLKVYDAVKTLAAEVADPADNPYDFAKQLERYLSSDVNFHYKSDVRDERDARCRGLSSAECFATIRAGYCQYYATLMTLLLRHDGIPARIAYGYLASTPELDGTEIVDNAASHWWVEAYFANYGWIEFDPTGGSIGRPLNLLNGGTETPRPFRSVTPGGRGENGDEPTPRGSGGRIGPAGGPLDPTDPGSGPFIVLFVLLAFGVGVLAIASRRRGPRTAMDPDHAWGGLGRFAARFGLGPRPAQTVYEYAGALADAVPAMRAELSTVARAKVEVAYGRQVLAPDRLRAVGEAYRRVRYAIIRRGLGRLARRRR